MAEVDNFSNAQRLRKVRYNFTIAPDLKELFEQECVFNETKMSTVLGFLIAGYVEASQQERKEIEDKIK